MLNKIKKKIKSIRAIDDLYNLIYGNKKVERIKMERRRQLQQDGFEVVRLIEKILSEQGAVYYLDCGSLLGMARDGKFMDYDEDIDYSIYINQEFTWEKLYQVLSQNGFSLLHQFKYKNVITEQTYQFGSLTVDFFNHFDDEKNSIVYWYNRNKDERYETIDHYSVIQGKTMKVTGVQKIEINGLRFTAPNNYKNYLASIYTERWTKPDPNWVSANGPAYNLLRGERAIKEVAG